MIDRWIYNFFAALDKLCLMIDNLFKLMGDVKMNYYFTGLLIVMLVVLALCGGPGDQETT